MARGLNRCTFIGNLGKDPEIRYTGSGKPVANFSLAINESWKDAEGQQQEKVEWVNVVAWEKLAEIIQQYVKKGSKVYIEGKMQTRSYDDKNHPGEKKYITEIVANQLIMLDSKPQTQSEPAPAAAQTPAEPGSEQDLPFMWFIPIAWGMYEALHPMWSTQILG